jgi:anti-anti-sigma factor
MSLPPPSFTIEAADGPDAYVIRVEGELDLAGTSDLESALADAERSRADRILVDLEGLDFIDASALGILVSAYRRSAEDGNRLSLTRGTGEVARVFRLTSLDSKLPFTERISAGWGGR